MINTSWEKISKWYNEIVGSEGHYYHRQVIMPNVLRLLKLDNQMKVLDMGCGQGILGKYLIEHDKYWGLDLSDNLIKIAQKEDKNLNHRYLVEDATREIKTNERFDRIVMILSLQNMKKPFGVFQNCAKLLNAGGKIIMVLNHPAFRIPKKCDWKEIDGKQYRMEESYMSSMEIPIDSSPHDRKDNQTTFSYHFSISAYSEMLFDNGMVIEKIEEWISDKKSTGSKALMEDKARKEFPLFMAIVARKI